MEKNGKSCKIKQNLNSDNKSLIIPTFILKAYEIL